MSAAKAAQAEPAITVGAVLDEEVEVVEAEEDKEKALPPVLRKASTRRGEHRG